MKTCPNCESQKPLSEFGRNKNTSDGLTVWCKSCRNERARKWREDNLERAREVNRQNKRDERERKGTDHFRKYDRGWYVKNSEKKKKDVADSRKRNQKKVKAQNKLNKAVQYGRVVKPERCEHCNEVKDLDGHHYDYDKPLDVIWLCRSCHMKEHSEYIN